MPTLMMEQLSGTLRVLLVALALAGCATATEEQDGWTSLIDGNRGLENWQRVGNANWRADAGWIQADRSTGGDGYLVSRKSYRDVRIRAEFWVDGQANSGIFVRCTDPNTITPMNSYEVNIFDSRPEPNYGTGAIVGVAEVAPMPRAAGRWNVYDITAKGDRLTVVLNGVQTVSARDSRFSSGPIALQYGGGIVRFRKLQVKPL